MKTNLVYSFMNNSSMLRGKFLLTITARVNLNKKEYSPLNRSVVKKKESYLGIPKMFELDMFVKTALALERFATKSTVLRL